MREKKHIALKLLEFLEILMIDTFLVPVKLTQLEETEAMGFLFRKRILKLNSTFKTKFFTFLYLFLHLYLESAL